MPTDEQRAVAAEWILADRYGMSYGAHFERRKNSLATLIASREAAARADVIATALAICDEMREGAETPTLGALQARLRTLAATPPDRVVVAVSDLAALRAACSRAAALLDEAIVLDCADGSIGEDGLADVRRELVAALARLGESDGR